MKETIKIGGTTKTFNGNQSKSTVDKFLSGTPRTEQQRMGDLWAAHAHSVKTTLGMSLNQLQSSADWHKLCEVMINGKAYVDGIVQDKRQIAASKYKIQNGLEVAPGNTVEGYKKRIERECENAESYFSRQADRIPTYEGYLKRVAGWFQDPPRLETLNNTKYPYGSIELTGELGENYLPAEMIKEFDQYQ